jgi:hypothetical protein
MLSGIERIAASLWRDKTQGVESKEPAKNSRFVNGFHQRHVRGEAESLETNQ